MNAPRLDRSFEPGLLSRMGGAAQGGSAKTPEERDALNRQHDVEQKDSPVGATPDRAPGAPAGGERGDAPASPQAPEGR